ncbi:hypothetical protein GCM10020295_70590 [Streptomyces cinereospinus]
MVPAPEPWQPVVRLSHYAPGPYADRDVWRERLRTAPARGQWDPERGLRLAPLPHRSLQPGVAREAAARCADEWIVGIEDVTPPAREIHGLVRAGGPTRAREPLPGRRPYPLDDDALTHLIPGGSA